MLCDVFKISPVHAFNRLDALPVLRCSLCYFGYFVPWDLCQFRTSGA